MILDIERVTIPLPSCCEEKEEIRYLVKYKRYWWLPWRYIKDADNIPQLFESVRSINDHIVNMGVIFKGFMQYTLKRNRITLWKTEYI